MYGTVRRRRTLQVLNYMLFTVDVNGHIVLRTATTDGNGTQHAAQIKQSSVYERCPSTC